MANQPIRIKSLEDLHKYKQLIKENSNKTIANIKTLVSTEDSISVLHELKFNQLGYEPIQGYRLNFIEQLNQMFSHIVVLKGAELLLKTYPDKEFILNIGTQGGFDIVSCDDKIICECFSTTNPISNNKIKLDAEKLLKNNTAERKYIIFFSKEVNVTTFNNISLKYKEITFIRLDNIDI
jgi:hypothetical protein